MHAYGPLKVKHAMQPGINTTYRPTCLAGIELSSFRPQSYLLPCYSIQSHEWKLNCMLLGSRTYDSIHNCMLLDSLQEVSKKIFHSPLSRPPSCL